MNFLYYDKGLCYPKAEENPAMHPSACYPEYPFGPSCVSSTPNRVYEALRCMFHEMGLDAAHDGTAEWNPLGKWIHPGQRVVLKPNFVMHQNGSDHPEDLDSLVTHPSVIRCWLDYVYLALKGRGRVVVGDAPVKDCDFRLLMERRGYEALEKFFAQQPEFEVGFYDFRGPEEEGGQYQEIGHGVRVNLGEKSWFYQCGHDEAKYRIPNYDYRRVVSHHQGRTQEYLINSEILAADVIINLPKPKTHRKNGYTAALKNFVGVNYSKEYLPHHTAGACARGGDEYLSNGAAREFCSRLRLRIDENRLRIDRLHRGGHTLLSRVCGKYGSYLWRLYAKVNAIDHRRMLAQGKSLAEQAREGSHYANDTLWRTVLDLNLAVLYAARDGKLMDTPQRVILHCGDMVVSGEAEGPMAPSPKEQHMLLFAENPVAFDCIVTKIMGFDYQKFRTLAHVVSFAPLFQGQYEALALSSNDARCRGLLGEISFADVERPFLPGKGWLHHVELS